MKGGIVEKVAQAVLPPLVGVVTKLLFATCRVTYHGKQHCDATLESGKYAIVTFWHYAFIGAFPTLSKYSGVLMVSSSRDGEYIARLSTTFGFQVVRGSRNNQGVQALKELIRAVKKGNNAGIVADGSQGPARIAQPGAVMLASMTGLPILPVVWSASKYWSIRSWDKTSFPKPFSKVEFGYGEPLYVPKGAKGDELENYRVQLEERLNELYLQLWAIQGKSEH